MLPYGKQSISDADVDAVAAVLRGDWLTTGPTVDRFEAALSELTGGLPAVSCSSGTAALHVAYSGLGLGPGDEVITTPMTFVATASTASMTGAKIVFADVEPDTGLLDPAQVEAVITDRTRVVSAVDYGGHACDYDPLLKIASTVGALVLDDAAHSIGGTYRGRPVGSVADITTFSFFPTKNMTTLEGGAVIARDPEIAERAREFHRIGLIRDASRFHIDTEGPWHQEVHAFGLNYRLSDVACALGLSQLSRLAAFTARRAEIYARYCAGLADVDGLEIPVTRDWADPAWHLYPVRILGGRRREAYDHLRAAGIGVQVNYIPVYWHPVYGDLGYRRGLCPNAEAFYEAQLSLPMFADLSDADVDRVIDELRSLLA